MALYEMEDAKERVILVGVQENDVEPEEESLDELAELTRTAGAEVAGRLIQKREAMHPVTYIGKGKILELKELLWETDATGIICDDELTSVQLNHLEEELECKIVDRTLLILDIFAGRAVSREGKIQVELAQLNTVRRDLSDFEILFPVWEAESEQEDRERKNWRWTAV